MKNAPAQAVDLQLGAARKIRTRGVFKASPAAIEDARRKFAAAEAAVAVAITGPDLREFGAKGKEGDLVASVMRLEKALAIYVAIVVLEAPRRVLAAALKKDARQIRRWCDTIEAWREAPVMKDALDRVARALPRAM